MDPFASYAALDNPQQFWLELDEILHTPFHPASYASTCCASSNDQAEKLLQAKRIYVASVLAKFLHLCAASFNDNLTTEYNQDYCINRLFNSTVFRDDVEPTSEAAAAAAAASSSSSVASANNVAMHQLAAEEAIRIMQTSTSIPVLLMTYEIVLQYGDAFPSTYKSIQASASTVSFVGVRAFLHRLVHQIWAGSYAAQAEAKIGISDKQHSDVGAWNADHWDQDEPVSAVISKASTKPNSSSASKDIAIQISLREKAVRMLYEVCRVQKLEASHLKAFDERFIHHLFDLVEETRYHHNEDFNYRLIKLLVAMNEQYMVSALASTQTHSSTPCSSRPVNLVLSVLQQRLNASKTFGENLIFMLNRASSSDAEDVCMQLLVLKLLYLLFTTKETACYFYTNDLRVLVDIFVRELNDLPDESESLRHTYLRVLHPLLTNTQLCTYPYKRPQIRRLLRGLISHGHLNDISATTKRLVERCLRAEWCVELDRLDGTESVAKLEPIGGGEAHVKLMHVGLTSEGLPMLDTRIKERSSEVQATADSLAVTTEDQVANPISITTTMSPADATSTDVASVSASFASSAPPTASLNVAASLRTRDKRVASLSHAPCEAAPASALLRPNSAASFSRTTSTSKQHNSTSGSGSGNGNGNGNGNRRAVSAQSAPCTPPRMDSPFLAVGRRPTGRLYEQSRSLMGVNADADADTDDALSSSSSWHAHMLEEPGSESGKHQAGQAGQAGGRVSEPDANAMHSAHAHVQSGLNSDLTEQLGGVHYAGGSVDGGMGAPSSASVAGGAGRRQRRKPPSPPQARRVLIQSHSAELDVARSRPASAAECAHTTTSHVPASLGAAKAGARRRPPPPPPVASSGSAVATASTGHTRANVEHEHRRTDDMDNAQSSYIAERLGRGLRIR